MTTDLLRLMRDPNLIPSEKQTLLSDIAAQAAALDMPCYLVGGSVRDLLLGRPINDLDIIVEGDAINLGEALVQKIGGKLTPHHKFHTAIWHQTTDTIDLITARKETYSSPGALPTVTPSTIDDDLRRRDFTINAMAIRLDGDHYGESLDPLNGQKDLEQGIIRVLHPRSFVDDPTRIFRAIRYEQRYAFDIDPATFNLINSESLGVLGGLSGERIRHEVDLIFEEEHSAKMILRANGLNFFERIHLDLPPFNPDYAEFLDMDPTLDIPADRIAMGYMLWFMELTEASIQSVARRLCFTSDLEDSVSDASRLNRSLPFLADSKPSEWSFAIEKLQLLSIYAVYLVSGQKALLDYLVLWRHVKPHTTGDDLKARGLQPGPRIGEILTQLRAAWLDGSINTAQEEKEWLNKIT
ncbi:MAG: CCA tRNA nucleotidyltransferase [Chloroflexi bacterium]|nr:CCA tRNA nucleotidyltransferase [Chloroflexota bacterium]